MLNIKFIDQLLHVVYLLQIETYSGLAEVLQCQEKAPSNTVEYTGWVKKKWDLKKHGHIYSEIRQKKKKLVCFGKFSLNAAGLASNLSKLVEKRLRKMSMKLVTPL